jgi:hypothetical protein
MFKSADPYFKNLLMSVWNNALPFPTLNGEIIQSGKDVRFAKSSLEFSYTRKVVAWRNLIRGTGHSWITTEVRLHDWHGLRRFSTTYDRGEDPRLFVFQKSPHVMVQVFNQEKKDIEILIRNIDSGNEFRLESPFGFNGKNWVPFEFDAELYFLYSLSPLVVLRLKDYGKANRLEKLNEVKGFNPKWEHDLDESIGVYRGGSPALKINSNNIFGFTHAINPEGDIHAHRLGFFSLSIPNFRLEHSYLTNYKPDFLIDPYGMQIRDGNVLLDGTMAVGDIHLPESQIYNFRMRFELDSLKRFFKERSSDNA